MTDEQRPNPEKHALSCPMSSGLGYCACALSHADQDIPDVQAATPSESPHLDCNECKGRGWHIGECHPREECGACAGTGNVLSDGALRWFLIAFAPCKPSTERNAVEKREMAREILHLRAQQMGHVSCAAEDAATIIDRWTQIPGEPYSLEECGALKDAVSEIRRQIRLRMANPMVSNWDVYESDTDDVGTIDGFNGVVLMTGPIAAETGLKMSRETARNLAKNLLALVGDT